LKRAGRRRGRDGRRGGNAPAPSARAGRPAAGASIRFYPNDPDAPIGPIDVPAPAPIAGEPPYVIEGPRYAPAPYAPGTMAFQEWQGEASLARTIHAWEEFFDRDFGAWHSGAPLRVRLRAGRDLNAFYDRKSLQFFYDVDKITGRTVFAAESLDVVAHEAGHAVLDVYQPGYWSSVDLETASFHEAFADCSALLTTLTDAAVRKAFLEEAGGAGGRATWFPASPRHWAARSSTTSARARTAIPRVSATRTIPSATRRPTRSPRAPPKRIWRPSRIPSPACSPAPSTTRSYGSSPAR
jgi:hypothetical protein